jgi:hypothetical protein
MGGPGSGCHYQWWRSGKKDVVEDCRSLDANRWMREGILKAGVRHFGQWGWYRDATRKEIVSSISYEVNTIDVVTPWVRLFYKMTRTGEAFDYRIALRFTWPHFGGRRWWFTCPLLCRGALCGRRVGKLYLGGRYFGCRQCHGLTYTSCQESHKYDGLYRLMARNMGSDLDSVKRAMDSFGKRR